MDFSSIAGAVSIGGVAAAIIGMGALMIVPNVAKWASKKLAGFFG